ncbi:MAG: type II secretion system secretin GspD [Acidobacteriota bacterium]
MNLGSRAGITLALAVFALAFTLLAAPGAQAQTLAQTPEQPLPGGPPVGKPTMTQPLPGSEPVQTAPREAEPAAPAQTAIQPMQKTPPTPGAKMPTPLNEATLPSNETMVTLNFDSVDIRSFIKYISQISGRNFVIDDAVKGNVSVVSPQAISVKDAYKVFESVLEVNGYTTLPSGKYTKIVPSKTSRTRSMETVEGGREVNGQPDDRMVTQVIALRYIRSPEVRKVLTPMVSTDGLIADYPETNTLVVTDFKPNINRLIAIISQIDVPGAKSGLSLVSLKFAQASKVAQKIDKLMSQEPKKEGGGTRVAIVPDERTNSLLVLAEPDYLSQVKTLVSKLDVPNVKSQGNFRVYHLQHADAENLSKVLTDLLSKGGSAATTGEGGKPAPIVSDTVRFVADKSTNSLLITADQEDFPFINDVLGKLDIPRKQVYVEALIMEVSTDKAFSFGVDVNVANRQAVLGDSSKGGLIFGSSNPAGYQSVYNSSGSLIPPAGLALGAVAFPVKVGEVIYSNLQVLVNAAKTDNNFNIISTPQLMTLDNEEATITVAENRPFLTAQDVGQSTTDKTFQRFDYKDVGTTLKVTPQINEGNSIKLKIKQETSRVDETVTQQTGTLQPTTRKRLTETTVLVKDGQTIVLSGLIGKSRSEGNSKVPGLGDIPILGNLFKKRSEDDLKTNLFVFITPRIATTAETNSEILRDKRANIDSVIHLTQSSMPPIPKAPVMFGPIGKDR